MKAAGAAGTIVVLLAVAGSAHAGTAAQDYRSMGKYTYSDSHCKRIVDPIGIIFEGHEDLTMGILFKSVGNVMGWGSGFGTDQYGYANGKCSKMDGESRDNNALSSRSHFRVNGFAFRTSRYSSGTIHAFAASPHTEKVVHCSGGHFGKKHAVVPDGFREAQEQVVSDYQARGYQIESFPVHNRKPRRQCNGWTPRGTGRIYVINVSADPGLFKNGAH